MTVAMDALQQAIQMRRQQKGRLKVPASDKGINNKTLSQITNTRYARLLENCRTDGEGRLIKIKGSRTIANLGNDIVRILGKYNDTWDIIGYGTNIAYFNKSNGEKIVAKNDFTNPITDGVRYGQFFYTCNDTDGENIGYLDGGLDISYTGKVGTYTVGETITGATSNATATLVSDNSGTLTLKDFSQDFQSGETLTGASSGATSTSASTLGSGWTEITVTGTPKCRILFLYRNRLLAGCTEVDESEVMISKVDGGATVPFGESDSWVIGTNDGDASAIINPNAGRVNSFFKMGSQVSVLYDDGKLGYRINPISVTVSDVVQQNVDIEYEKIDFGGERGAIATTYGAFYVNETGLYHFKGTNNEEQITQLLDRETIESFDFTNADIVFDPLDNIVYVTCKKDSVINNYIIGYNIETKGIFFVSGVTINNFYREENKIYGTDSIDGTIYRLFDGYEHDGKPIFMKYETQEIDFGDDTMLKEFRDIYIHGSLNENTEVTIHVDAWDRNGFLIEDYIILKWTADALVTGTFLGVGKFRTGKAYNTAYKILKENYGHRKIKVRNFSKVRFRIEESSVFPLEIFSVTIGKIMEKKEMKKNNLSASRLGNPTDEGFEDAFYLIADDGAILLGDDNAILVGNN